MKRRTTRYIVCALLCSVVSSPLTAQKAVRIEQPSYTFDRAQQMYREGNYAGCIDLMTQFREQATRTTDKAKADYLIAVSAYAAKEPDALDRIENYLFCHLKTPHTGQAQLLRGHIYFDKGMYDKAIGIYEAIDLDKLTPDNQADLLLHLGSAYANTGQNDKAEPCFTAII